LYSHKTLHEPSVTQICCNFGVTHPAETAAPFSKIIIIIKKIRYLFETAY
jgi:hypothetical protein